MDSCDNTSPYKWKVNLIQWLPQKAYNLICFNIQKIFLKGNDLYFKEMLHNTVPDTHLLNFYAVI